MSYHEIKEKWNFSRKPADVMKLSGAIARGRIETRVLNETTQNIITSYATPQSLSRLNLAFLLDFLFLLSLHLRCLLVILFLSLFFPLHTRD